MAKHSADDVRDRWNENVEAYAEKCSRYGDANGEVVLTPTILSWFSCWESAAADRVTVARLLCRELTLQDEYLCGC